MVMYLREWIMFIYPWSNTRSINESRLYCEINAGRYGKRVRR